MWRLPGLQLPETAEPEGQEREQAVAALLPYLLSHRSRLAALQAQASGSVDAADADAEDVNAEVEGAMGLAQQLWPAAAAAIDTAILKVTEAAALQ